jgi:predicted dehydrogenase
MARLRIIQVGLGGWGSDWYREVLARFGDIELVAFVDEQASALERACEKLALPKALCFPSLERACEAVEADAVLVTAALAAHVPLSLSALAAGLHVLVEKPFAPSIAEAERVVRAAKQRERMLMVAQNYRYLPAVATAKKLIAEGELGPVGSVHLDFRRNANGNPGSANRHHTMLHPLLMDMSIHHYDLLRFVLGREPREVFCRAKNPPWSNFRDPAEAVATIEFEDGIVVSYRASWVSPGAPTPWGGAWRIECRDGVIELTSRADRGLSAEQVVIQRLGKPSEPVPLVDMPHMDRAGLLSDFVQAVRTGRERGSTGSDNLRTLSLMAAAIVSAESGDKQRVV